MSDANRTHVSPLPNGRDGRFASRTQGGWLLGLLTAVVVLLAVGGDSLRSLLRYERAAIIQNGEVWRLLTGHLVHGSFSHMALNLAGMVLLAGLFPRHYSLRAWLVIAAASIAVIDVGFVWYEPQLEWYVGLSGVLHGALAGGAITWWRYESKGLAMAMSALLAAKLAWEQSNGALPFSGDMNVIVAAHLYGAIGGAIAGALIWCVSRGWPRGSRPL
jgi:rhomboid family GlyGly-CTERM serine protease